MTSLEAWLFRGGAVVLALHFVDEAVVDRAAGTGVDDHLSVRVLAAVVVVVAIFYPRFPAIVRALLGFVDVPLAAVSAAMHVQDARWNGAGGAVLVEAAAKDPRLKVVVLGGSTARSLGDVRQLSVSDQISGFPYWAVAYGTIAVLDQSLPGRPLIDLAREIAPKPALFIASNELVELTVAPKYAAAYGKPGALWRVDAGHTKGLAGHPQDYERRVIALFDMALR